jgi:beta-glucanase (GH16 family)
VSNGILRIALAAGTESVRSGRISTQGRFSASEGYFEVCARLPEMHGVRAVFRIMSPSMGLFFNDTGRGGTEIHVFQSLGLSEAPDRSLFQGIYWNPYVGTRIPTNEEGHILSPAPDAVVTNDQKQVVVMAPPRTLGGAVSPAIFARKEQFPWGKDFHRYGVWWSREGYRFFVDGRVTHEISEAWSGVPEFLETWLDLPLKSRVHTGVRAELELDYVRVYAPTSAVAGASVPVAAVPSSPVPPGPEKKP